MNHLAASEADKGGGWAYLVALRVAVLEKEARENAPFMVEISKDGPELPSVPEINDRARELKKELSEQGHVLVTRGKFVICRRCKARKRPGNAEGWLQTPCTGEAKAVKHCRKQEDSSQSAAVNTPSEMLLVSRAKRKSILQQRAKERRDNESKRRKLETEASQTAIAQLTEEHKDAQAEISREDIPFTVHDSHTNLVYIGGFVGCSDCGLHASNNWVKNRLVQQCRKHCPDGTKGHVERLKRGKHPKGGQGNEWPDGSLNPTPKRVRRLQQ